MDNSNRAFCLTYWQDATWLHQLIIKTLTMPLFCSQNGFVERLFYYTRRFPEWLIRLAAKRENSILWKSCVLPLYPRFVLINYYLCQESDLPVQAYIRTCPFAKGRQLIEDDQTKLRHRIIPLTEHEPVGEMRVVSLVREQFTWLLKRQILHITVVCCC